MTRRGSLSGDLGSLELEMLQQRRATVRRFAAAANACRQLALDGFVETDAVYLAAANEFHAALELVEAWEALDRGGVGPDGQVGEPP